MKRVTVTVQCPGWRTMTVEIPAPEEMPDDIPPYFLGDLIGDGITELIKAQGLPWEQPEPVA